MLRLRFGEPVRFKFLIGMLNSFNSGAFQIACLRFLNTFVETALSYKERVHIQAEVEEAGFDISQLKKLVSKVRITFYFLCNDTIYNLFSGAIKVTY